MLTETLIAATRAGAAELQRFFNGAFEFSHKERVNNLVTEADHAAERAIIGVIQAAYPDHFIVSEERASFSIGVFACFKITGFPLRSYPITTKFERNYHQHRFAKRIQRN